MSRVRVELTPAQLAVLAQAREKAKIVIAERAKLNAQAKEEAVSEESPLPPPELEPLSEESPPEPVPPKEDSEPRVTLPKYRYINGMYIKIK